MVYLQNIDHLIGLKEVHGLKIDPIVIFLFYEDGVYVYYDTVHDIYGVGLSEEEAFSDFMDNVKYCPYLV